MQTTTAMTIFTIQHILEGLIAIIIYNIRQKILVIFFHTKITVVLFLVACGNSILFFHFFLHLQIFPIFSIVSASVQLGF